VQDVDASAGERADGLVMGLSLVALAPVEGLADHIDPDREPFLHAPSSKTSDRHGALTPVVALQSERSRCLISGDESRRDEATSLGSHGRRRT
jgi:hypothetical protein